MSSHLINRCIQGLYRPSEFWAWPLWRSAATQPHPIQVKPAGMIQIDGENHQFAEVGQVERAFGGGRADFRDRYPQVVPAGRDDVSTIEPVGVSSAAPEVLAIADRDGEGQDRIIPVHDCPYIIRESRA